MSDKNKKQMGDILVRIRHIPLSILLGMLESLPLEITSPLASLMAFTARRIVKYRLRIVRANLRDSFPEMDAAQLKSAEREFYRHLGRCIFETIRLKKMSVDEIKKRCRFDGLETAHRILHSGRDIIVYTAHYGNWEMQTSFSEWMNPEEKSLFCPAHVYRPLKNKWFDSYFLSLRSRFNTPVKQKSVLRYLLSARRAGKPTITGFLSDQKPGKHTSSVNVSFLGRETPFIKGTEELARKLDAAVIYFDMQTISPGYYKCHVRLITDSPKDMQDGEITATYARMLEETIQRNPAAYLWSHNRWRLNKKDLHK